MRRGSAKLVLHEVRLGEPLTGLDGAREHASAQGQEPRRADAMTGPQRLQVLVDEHVTGGQVARGVDAPTRRRDELELHWSRQLATIAEALFHVTHAAHPNHLDKHDPDHLSVPNRGPSLKVNAVQRYATDAPGAAAWKRACRTADVPNQVFVSKNTVPCGSTVGPIMATRLGIRTVDVGIPVLSMHSARELCGVHDPGLLARAGVEFLTDAG